MGNALKHAAESGGSLEELFDGKRIDYPHEHTNVTFKKASKAKGKGPEQLHLSAE